MEKKVPVMLVEYTASKDKEASLLPTAEPDNYAMGTAMAEELLKDYNGNLNGKTFSRKPTIRKLRATAEKDLLMC